ncbi:hypothetical protein BKA93DRAFT_331645 [Sparassis latifolia]
MRRLRQLQMPSDDSWSDRRGGPYLYVRVYASTAISCWDLETFTLQQQWFRHGCPTQKNVFSALVPFPFDNPPPALMLLSYAAGLWTMVIMTMSYALVAICHAIYPCRSSNMSYCSLVYILYIFCMYSSLIRVVDCALWYRMLFFTLNSFEVVDVHDRRPSYRRL